MAIFNTARLLDVLVRGRIAEAAPAREQVDEMNDQMESVMSEHPTHNRLGLMEERLLRAMAEMEARIAERMAGLEARVTRLVLQALGIALGAIGLAVGIILGFG